MGNIQPVQMFIFSHPINIHSATARSRQSTVGSRCTATFYFRRDRWFLRSWFTFMSSVTEQKNASSWASFLYYKGTSAKHCKSTKGLKLKKLCSRIPWPRKIQLKDYVFLDLNTENWKRWPQKRKQKLSPILHNIKCNNYFWCHAESYINWNMYGDFCLGHQNSPKSENHIFEYG